MIPQFSRRNPVLAIIGILLVMYIDSIYIYISTRTRAAAASAAAAAVGTGGERAPTLLVGRNKFKAAH